MAVSSICEIIPQRWVAFAVGTFYVANSVAIIMCNKYLMHTSRFPQPLALVSLHMGSGFVFTLALLFTCPSLFPRFHVLKNDPWGTIMRMVPISACCAVSYVLGNAAYVFVSVAMTQILKELNIIIVYMGSLLVGLAVWNWRVCLVLVSITAVAVGAVQGDVNFVWTGVFIQMISQVFDCTKVLMMNYFLSGEGSANKLDQFTLLLVITPFAFLLLGATQAFRWDDQILSQAAGVWPMLLVNLLMAYSLNIAVTTFLKVSNAVTLTLMSIVKNAAIVSISCVTFHDDFKPLQIVFFSVSLVLIALHGFMKMYKSDFDQGFDVGLMAMCFDAAVYLGFKKPQVEAIDEESPPLLSSPKSLSPKIIAALSGELADRRAN